ncbi:DUF1329 domain-containing protein [Pontibacterium granulatum]|uniref:DUF1329 domain-containing protein n=1 Tax=Pontibacterium granulatum TaxID=2036029 RepID=UPI00249B66EE|nr:DUF1329 domain-containing protein [Pontibacterium granulatum]MDI3323448.1 DUF1329 domain-containing protein [Pontibacterium granulatum]
MQFKPTSLILGMALALSSSALYAAVSAEEAAKLGDSLTPMGGEVAGNTAGTIPAWTGGLSTSDDRYTNPYANEKPLFTITADNMAQYQANLTPGQQALMQKYPDSYKIQVYPTHRSASIPDSVVASTKENALNAALTSDGNGVSNLNEGVAFPIPANGLEAIWNHMTRFRGGALERTFVQVPVQANGSFTPVKINEKMSWPTYLNGETADQDNILFYFVQQVQAPARLTGNVLLVHETVNQITQPRQAWTYNAGQRRVRRAPQIAYDAPGTATDGQRTTDNLDMFNGAPDRYDWKLVGKQELYIPYNNFKLADRSLKYKEILQPGHINPELTRYELHRVWKVEATLKESARHIYAKRTFYIDEDTWQIAVVDHYDGRGELWRVGEAYHLQYRDVNVPWIAAESLYDLQSGRYLVGSLTNEEGIGFDFTQRFKYKDFTPQAIRRLGKR